MIAWTTAREVAFEKVCSYSTSGAFFNSNAFTTGVTQNQTGTTQSFSSRVTNVFGTTILNSSSGSTEITTSTTVQTSTTQSYNVYLTISSSSSEEVSQWTTTTNPTNSEETTFTSAWDTKNTYYTTETQSSSTRLATTQQGTTKGNAADTIYFADSTEVLWVINENPQWSKPLTENAVSTTQTTISDLRETVGLVTAAEPPQTIGSSESLSSYTFTDSLRSFLEVQANFSPHSVNAEAVEEFIYISVSGESQSGELNVSGQAEVVYAGGTETVAASSATIATATQTDVFGGSWQKTALVYSTVTNTKAIDNGVQTFTISGGTASSCYGNTTKEVGFVGGTPAIASPPRMTVYSPAGVKLGDAIGLRFTGDGITNAEFSGSEGVTIVYLQTANDGELTKYSTASPVVPSWVTLSSNSFTYLTTTLEDGETVDTEISGEFGIDGATWQTVARNREDGLIGGDLAEGETALIRINRGLYKNQDGDTSFFEGNDTTYVGTKDTTYWYPVSYLEPAFEQVVFAVPRNTSTWPT